MTQDIDIEAIAAEVATALYEEHNSKEPLSLANAVFDFAHSFLAAVDAKRAELNPAVGVTTKAQLVAMQHGWERSFSARDPKFAVLAASDKDVQLFTYPPAPQSTVPDGIKARLSSWLNAGPGKDDTIYLTKDEAVILLAAAPT